tara:strand:- start:145 stop:294 length:150 start_codon:yes stop_codon:yes gene_type:complete
MMFEEAQDMAMLYSLDRELTCQCDEVHTCQQCYEEVAMDVAIASAKLEN